MSHAQPSAIPTERDLTDHSNPDETITLTPAEVEDQFRLLFQDAQRASPYTTPQVAEMLGMNARTYQRLLYGPSRFSAAQLTAIGEVLGLDKSRGTVAIQRFKDYRYYYNPYLTIAIDMLQRIVELLERSELPMCTDLPPEAMNQLTEHIAKTIIKELSDRERRRKRASTIADAN